MPIVRVENAGELSPEQCKELIQKLTEVVSEVTGKGKQYVYVTLTEIERSKLINVKDYVKSDGLSISSKIANIYHDTKIDLNLCLILFKIRSIIYLF